jgi:hypothetical protein
LASGGEESGMVVNSLSNWLTSSDPTSSGRHSGATSLRIMLEDDTGKVNPIQFDPP